MPALTPALKGLCASIDFLWRRRDRRTDGWYRAPRDGHSLGHNPGHNGYSHAIDVDKDGIDPMWIINHIARDNGVMFYIIWDVRVWGVETGWNGHPYHIPTGGSDHRDHLHIETYQPSRAETFGGQWFTNAPGRGGLGPAPGEDPGIGAGFGPADPRDYRDAITAAASWGGYVAGRVNQAANNIIGTRAL